MIVQTITKGSEDVVVILIGAGLIGRSVLRQLTLMASEVSQDFVSVDDWTQPCPQNPQILEKLDIVINDKVRNGLGKIRLFWAAGSGSFLIDRDNTSELTGLKAILDWLASRSWVDKTSVTLVSSAGAFHLGKSMVRSMDDTGHSNPYRQIKRQCEELVLNTGIQSSIYRISSVVGFDENSNRRNMVSELVRCALERRLGLIFSLPGTLRDYVFVDDVARFMAKDTIQNRTCQEPSYLVHGKPYSPLELVRLVANVTGKRVRVSFAKTTSNSENISFSPCMADPNFQKTGMTTIIKRVEGRILEKGL